MTQAAPSKVCTRCGAEVQADLNACPYDGSALEEQEADPLVGKIFAGKYEIESVLGKGGMSMVYKAKDVFMERTVAVKILHTHLVADKSAIQRFRQEAQAAGGLNHPNIITVYDFGLTPEEQAYLIMECFEGPTLSEVLDVELRISPDRALRLCRQICSGLNHAHEKGVVHRDLKPSNLCIVKKEDGTEVVKIVDFGIAKLLPQEGKQRQQLTQTGQIFGSPLFMSPEQCQGKPLDARSDIYSLGCLMYEALTGAPPFMGETAFDTMTMHINDTPKPMKKAAPEVNVPPEIETPIMRCLEKKPENRYATAALLKADLPPLPEDSQQITDQWAPSWYRSIRHNRTARIAVVVALSVVASMVPVVIVFFCYPGPDKDTGTLYQRLIWGTKISAAETAMNAGNYALARHELEEAREIAEKNFSDKGKLIITLNLEDRLGSEMEDFKYAEDANKRILKLFDEKALNVYKEEMSALDNLRLSEMPGNKKAKAAEARVGRIETAARELFARQLYLDEERLLKRGLEVDRDILGDNHPRIAELKTLLAECYIHMQMTPPVKGLLQEALDIWRKAGGEGSPNSVRALMRLGQWERDQTQMVEADRDLTKALALARKLDKKNKDNLDLLLLCINSYADYLKQVGKNGESAQYFNEASQLARANSLSASD